MYQVILADDEPWAAYGLKQLVNWEELGFTICDTALNGQEALDKCISLQPDVLISDIRMPGMDGIELLEALRQYMPDLQVVFISGYSEFSYAQKAVQYGAFDYLVKQISAEQLQSMLARLAQKLSVLNHGINGDAYFALLDEDSKLSISEWIAQNGAPWQYPLYHFLTFDVRNNEFGNIHTEYWTEGSGHHILRTGKNKVSVLLGFSHQEQRMDYLKLLNRTTSTRSCGISLTAEQDCSFSSLYQQSNIAFYTAKMLKIQHPIQYTLPSKEFEIKSALNQIEEAVKMNDEVLCQASLKHVFELSSDIMIDQAASIYNNIIILSGKLRNVADDLTELKSYQQLISEYADYDDMFSYLFSLFIPDNKPNNFSSIELLQFIDENYCRDIRVIELAERFHFTTNYFSTYFKKITGVTLTKYITSKRIHLAKQLLLNTDLSIQEIADRIGYNDYFQFNKIFKREAGVSPGRFRNATTRSFRP